MSEITNRFPALENLNDDEDVNRTWENIKENTQTSAKESLGLQELKQNKPWFDEECLSFSDQEKGDKTDCNNLKHITFANHLILYNILLSRLIPYAAEIIGEHQCGFRRNRSTTDHVFCIRQILEKKWEYNAF